MVIVDAVLADPSKPVVAVGPMGVQFAAMIIVRVHTWFEMNFRTVNMLPIIENEGVVAQPANDFGATARNAITISETRVVVFMGDLS